MNPSHDNAQLATMRSDLKLHPEEVSLENLIPIVTPASFFSSGAWPGPHLTMEELGVTWAVLGADQTMLYLNTATSEYWEGKSINWREYAIKNLAKFTGEIPATHQYNNEAGEPFALVFMHADGCGPSRLLLHNQISGQLTDEYDIAVPEMSVGIALRSSATDAERTGISELVRKCFTEGSRPVSNKFYSSKHVQKFLEEVMK